MMTQLYTLREHRSALAGRCYFIPNPYKQRQAPITATPPIPVAPHYLLRPSLDGYPSLLPPQPILSKYPL